MPISHLFVFFGETSRSSAHFLIGLFCYCAVLSVCIFWKLSPVGLIVCKYFLPVHRLSFLLFFLCKSLYSAQNLISLSPICLFLVLFLFPQETDIRKQL